MCSSDLGRVEDIVGMNGRILRELGPRTLKLIMWKTIKGDLLDEVKLRIGRPWGEASFTWEQLAGQLKDVLSVN